MRATQRKGWKPRVLPAAVLATLAAGAVAHAAAQPKTILRGYQDGVAGTLLMEGDYGAVITQLGSHSALYLSDRLSGTTNLCVAYTMTRQFTAAVPECEDAITQARRDATGATLAAHIIHDQHLALAYSNRAVLHALMAQPDQAANDIARAHALAPSADFVSQNLTVLGAPLPKVVSTKD